ncbi:hypothetical protein [Pseudomonas abietaniphila]|uniref:Uncharacterized protein n=1 Tax=Pseudomonas abietaniphila TaxID=89065 RepID=A0A1G8QX76_9PSED|nr:hypothetical protein [Pseudomonas abietaniphila]SDJ09352.1 hypothetical protein SAMN05216605_12195 [Pseudomonas abietaniphila]
MALALNDPSVQSALITGCFAFASTVLAAVCAQIIGKRFSDRKALERKLELSEKDIAFLLRVEALHVDMNRQDGRKPNKIKVRDMVREQGLTFSGRFTPGRLKNPRPN